MDRFIRARAEQAAMDNWAATVARGKAPEKGESYVIDSQKSIERQKDPFFKTHKFERKK